MYSRLSKIIKTEDLSIRYKDCDLFMKVSSVEKIPVKTVKVIPLTVRIFKTAWGIVNLN